MPAAPTLVWFRQDLRLQDNPALHAAVARGGAIVPVFVFDFVGEWGWPLGRAARWWLQKSIAALDASLRARGSRLVVLQGDTEKVLRELVRETGATAVYWNRRYELAAVARDGWIEADLTTRGIEVRTFNSALLHEPHEVANRQGRPFQVFSPYWRTCLTRPVSLPLKLAEGPLRGPEAWPRSLELKALDLQNRALMGAATRDEAANTPAAVANTPHQSVAAPIKARDHASVEFDQGWQPGESGAQRRLREFVSRAMADYAEARDLPAEEGTSRLSPHLHFGEIGPRQIWAAVRAAGRATGVFPPNKGATVFLNEVGWREFAHHLLFNFPHTQELPLREEFARFPWAEDPGGAKLRAWQLGRTGYPIVDAGMRQLAGTGWMHNRVRMIVASFLVKHLRLSWRVGARWFWDNLVDADLANNTLGWQWSGGCGADAAPYFRIMAPVLQARKFDSRGEYVRRWVPELGRLAPEHIHAPWEAPRQVLAAAGVKLGETYPRPIVDHATARAEALAAFRTLRGGALRV